LQQAIFCWFRRPQISRLDGKIAAKTEIERLNPLDDYRNSMIIKYLGQEALLIAGAENGEFPVAGNREKS
jgi:hypothetical protein